MDGVARAGFRSMCTILKVHGPMRHEQKCAKYGQFRSDRLSARRDSRTFRRYVEAVPESADGAKTRSCNRMISRRGGHPNIRVYSRLNCDALS